MDNTLERIWEMMYCELDDMGKKEKLDSKDIELIGDFVDILKDINEIESHIDMGYSQMNGSSYMNGRSGRMMPMYRNGSSYGRGRSMNDGYSRHGSRDEMLDRLQDIADMAQDEKDRKAVERLMSQMSER